jgi:hypothetical protein
MNDDRTEVDRPAATPTMSGLAFVGLLVCTLVVAMLLGQLTGQDTSDQPSGAVAHLTGVTAPKAAANLLSPPDLAFSPDFANAPDPGGDPQQRNRPIGVGSLSGCPANLGGLLLGDHARVPGWGLERWDCGASKGPWSVVIRATGGHLGFHSAVVTFPFDRAAAGIPVSEPPGAVWNPGVQRLVWPLAGSHAEIVGDLGRAKLTDLAMGITVEAGKPHLLAHDGYDAVATIPYLPTVVHEMRYSTGELGQGSRLGDRSVYTGVVSGAAFESQAFEARAKSAGLVRGRQAIYSDVGGHYSTLAWERVPGEVTYIGFSGDQTTLSEPNIEALRALADKGRVLTPEQWLAKDRIPLSRPQAR